jgi:UDP-N-acetylglucosamine 2-epimerase
LIHTGQHYDTNMSDVFFQQQEIPTPDLNLGVGSASHARQTAEIMTRFEIVLERKPDLVLVYGDVNSTVAAGLVCSKLLVPVGHVEAGLRSFDRTMPEEINRLLTDQAADWLFTPSEDGDKNLEREGIPGNKIHRVGNVMIDSGGIQEETTYLKVPCLTLRDNTERPVTVTMGANILVGQDGARLSVELTKIFEGRQKQGTIPPLWDGHAGERIAPDLK